MSNYYMYVIYDETYGVIMRKFRASMEPFWELKISKINM